jgi:hypothetical protein
MKRRRIMDEGYVDDVMKELSNDNELEYSRYSSVENVYVVEIMN